MFSWNCRYRIFGQQVDNSSNDDELHGQMFYANIYFDEK